MNIYVGNLAQEVTEDELRQAFQSFGQVTAANIIKDKFTGLSRGFGFVEMPNNEEAKAALQGVNGKEMGGKNVSVNEARPKTDKRGGGGFRGGHGGGYGGGGGRRNGGGGGGRRW